VGTLQNTRGLPAFRVSVRLAGCPCSLQSASIGVGFPHSPTRPCETAQFNQSQQSGMVKSQSRGVGRSAAQRGWVGVGWRIGELAVRFERAWSEIGATGTAEVATAERHA
jgi:hypothetical protein